jgi:hypothetical protein
VGFCVKELKAQGINLPNLQTLRISNLTTFSTDKVLNLIPGINVILGGNYTGKTTIVNAIKFGIFGLTVNRTDEELSARYFTSRIKEQERRSLGIFVSCMIAQRLVTARRTLFSSGSPRLEVQVVNPQVNPHATPPGAIERSFSTSKEYLSCLCEMMGLDDLDDVEFVLTLLLADEDRHTVLWREDCSRKILKLLTPPEEYSQLKWLERETAKKKQELNNATKTMQALGARLDQERDVVRFLTSRLDAISKQSDEDRLQTLASLRSAKDDLNQQIESLQHRVSGFLTEKSAALTDLSLAQSRLQDTLVRIDHLRSEEYRSIMQSDDPQGVHMLKHLIHEGRCPYCDSDLSEVLGDRENRRVCPLCGNEITTSKARGVGELEIGIAAEQRNETSLRASILKLTTDLQTKDTDLHQCESRLDALRTQERETIDRLSQVKDLEEAEQEKLVLDRQLQSVKQRLEEYVGQYNALKKGTEDAGHEIEEIRILQEKGREAVKSEIKTIFDKVVAKFRSFVLTATNGELQVELSPDMVPSIRGRKIYSPDDASQFERGLMDIALRTALVSVIAELSEANTFMVVENPDDLADESYIKYLAKAFADTSKNVSILVTTSNLEFTKSMLDHHEPEQRRNRLTDLSLSGTSTQKSYYAPLLTDWIRR